MADTSRPVSFFHRAVSRLKMAIYIYLSYTPKGFRRNIRAFRFGIPLVLKRSRYTVSTESEALNFLHSTNLDLPIPRVWDSLDIDGENWTLMSMVPGITLYSLLMRHELSDDELQCVFNDLLLLVKKLWTIRQRDYPQFPQGMIMCSASGQGLPDHGECYELRGPLPALQHYANRAYYANGEEELLKEHPELAQLVSNDEIVWVHCDLRSTNIVVDKGRLSGVVDWEASGWQPRHWQLMVCRPAVMTNQGPIANAWKRAVFDSDVEEAYNAGVAIINDFV
ncbi:kinase-like protein [Cylindrobasidium torrendii FP15055 ss-10]|uniref:Kinase-like protein n=1 Tax=Cylindrobasidium torrendii FP15055 ss-10 TaxID=1314674 RepID=A0A0D7BSE2_9AGAR|nr:kinase-like protein [Cylindrobasidium torrendii FP15055 ss-10]